MADIRSSYKGIVVAIGGPPHSGKSVFLAELYRQLLARKPSGTFLQRACPDGEGMWSDESDPTLVAEIRRKGKFSSEFIAFTLNAIENLGKHFPIVLLDLGGIRSAENAEILRRSTHCVVLSSEETEDQPWVEFVEAEGCKPFAIFRSRLDKCADGTLVEGHVSELDTTQVPVQGTFWQMDREGSAEPFRPAVSQFAEWLIENANAIR